MPASIDEKTEHSTPKAEMLCGLLGLLLVLATTAYLVYVGITQNGPPLLSAYVSKVSPQGDMYLAEVVVHNAGDHTAQDATLRASLYTRAPDAAPRLVEQRHLRFNYIPPSSDRHGALLLTHNPATHDLHLQILGYTRP